MGLAPRRRSSVIKRGNPDKLTPKEIVTMKNFIVAALSRELTHCQFLVLIFVFDRTYRYGKMWETIPMSHFINGVYTNEEAGGLYYALPLPYSERMIRKCITDLCNVQFIERDRVSSGAGRWVNRYRLHPHLRMTVRENRVIPWGDSHIILGFNT